MSRFEKLTHDALTEIRAQLEGKPLTSAKAQAKGQEYNRHLEILKASAPSQTLNQGYQQLTGLSERLHTQTAAYSYHQIYMGAIIGHLQEAQQHIKAISALTGCSKDLCLPGPERVKETKDYEPEKILRFLVGMNRTLNELAGAHYTHALATQKAVATLRSLEINLDDGAATKEIALTFATGSRSTEVAEHYHDMFEQLSNPYVDIDEIENGSEDEAPETTE